MSTDHVLALRGITKRFPGVIANDDISLDIYAGEVHGILGENGAGKSTLISILAGMQQPDEGEIVVAGDSQHIASPQVALALGIGTVYQHSHLIPSLTVLENLMLGGSWKRRRDPSATLERFAELSQLLMVRIDPEIRVERLSLGQQQQVEIIRALWHGERVLILDEPTSMLTPQGVTELVSVVKRLSGHGVAVIFITHKLGEAYDLSDRITILRQGRVAGALSPKQLAGLTREQAIDTVVSIMFARDDKASTTPAVDRDPRADADAESATPLPREQRKQAEHCRIKLLGARTGAEPGECPLRGANLTLWPGEIMGVAGVDGNGQKHLAEVLAGQRTLVEGRLVLDQRDITATTTVTRRALGIRYITDERLGEGTVAAHPVATNLLLKSIGKSPYWSRGITRWKRIFRRADEQVRQHDVRTPSVHTPVGKLSGGNIQKVLLARELTNDARLVIFNKPTYGLDLNSTRAARAHIRAGAGTVDAALLVISNELDELMETCHRIAVMESGVICGIVENKPGAEEEIGRLMTAAEAA